MLLDLNRVYSKTPRNLSNFSTEIFADILDGCGNTCAGCFINKKNTSTTDSISYLREVIEKNPLLVDEVTLSPVDVFQADNFNDMFNSEDIWYVFNNTAIAFTTTLSAAMSVITERLETIHSVYSDSRVSCIPDLDFQVIIDLDKYINDTEYKSDLVAKLEVLTASNDIPTSVQFRSNYYEDMFKTVSHEEYSTMFREDFNAPFFVVPSFLHKKSNALVENKLSKFNRLLKEEFRTLSCEHKEKYNIFDNQFRSHTWTMFSIYENKTYIMPVVYGQVMQRSSEFQITTAELSDSYIDTNIELAESMPFCNGCDELFTCASRCTHMYIKSRGLKECPYAIGT